jgi:hypothetical protein
MVLADEERVTGARTVTITDFALVVNVSAAGA